MTSRAGNPTRAGGKEAGGKEACNKWGAHPGKNAFSDNKWGAHPSKTAVLDNKWVTLVTSRAGNPTRAGGKEARGKEAGAKRLATSGARTPVKMRFQTTSGARTPVKQHF